MRATPEELRKNLEALECSLDEISSDKNTQQKNINPCKIKASTRYAYAYVVRCGR